MLVHNIIVQKKNQLYVRVKQLNFLVYYILFKVQV